jgi:hypothetical protein
LVSFGVKFSMTPADTTLFLTASREIQQSQVDVSAVSESFSQTPTSATPD